MNSNDQMFIVGCILMLVAFRNEKTDPVLFAMGGALSVLAIISNQSNGRRPDDNLR